MPLWISPSAFPSENEHLNAENYDILNNYCELQISGSDIPEVLELQMANLTKHCDVLLLQILGERGKMHRISDNGFHWYWKTQIKAKRELIHSSSSMYSVQNNTIYCCCHQLFSNKNYPANIEGLFSKHKSYTQAYRCSIRLVRTVECFSWALICLWGIMSCRQLGKGEVEGRKFLEITCIYRGDNLFFWGMMHNFSQNESFLKLTGNSRQIWSSPKIMRNIYW